MQSLGALLIFFGIGSIILNSIGLEFKLLMWLGEGYTGRLLIAGVGLLLVIAGYIKDIDSEENS